jgi:hypothetical protein
MRGDPKHFLRLADQYLRSHGLSLGEAEPGTVAEDADNLNPPTPLAMGLEAGVEPFGRAAEMTDRVAGPAGSLLALAAGQEHPAEEVIGVRLTAKVATLPRQVQVAQEPRLGLVEVFPLQVQRPSCP